WTSVNTAFSTMWGNVKTAITTAFNEVRGWFATAWAEVVSFLSSINLLQVGADIVSSLWQGLKNMWQSGIDWWYQNVAPLFGASPSGQGIQGGGELGDPLSWIRDQLAIGQGLGGAANYWANLYEEQSFLPLLKELDALDAKTQEYND